MALGASRGSDATAGFDKLPGGTNGLDLKKQMKKPTQPDAAEAIIEGATADSITEFVTKKRLRQPARPATGLLAQIRRLFGR